tara:strand:- start:3362 stop:3502 length:141 start_codon:yes stop_codon:yes gene_type:complete
LHFIPRRLLLTKGRQSQQGSDKDEAGQDSMKEQSYLPFLGATSIKM